ncbi:hypothetical protein GN244_ATG13745 [Phytophthora infestans]|uniref:Short chain dehydrogenase n=1 Tax=Phytophthora infestans TaxID=4787 RepID=A0A833W9X8_PHYIN|nr:hypothetical protein GN244_ATG13745 [Phytophthora infestans]KAF4147351.1 hypothetical protein GN958_ATG03473 [Phytophthora infestans]
MLSSGASAILSCTQHGHSAMDLRESNVAVVAMNPGYVATDMSNHQGGIKPFDAAVAITGNVATLSLGDSGKFFNATLPG